MPERRQLLERIADEAADNADSRSLADWLLDVDREIARSWIGPVMYAVVNRRANELLSRGDPPAIRAIMAPAAPSCERDGMGRGLFANALAFAREHLGCADVSRST